MRKIGLNYKPKGRSCYVSLEIYRLLRAPTGYAQKPALTHHPFSPMCKYVGKVPSQPSSWPLGITATEWYPVSFAILTYAVCICCSLYTRINSSLLDDCGVYSIRYLRMLKWFYWWCLFRPAICSEYSASRSSWLLPQLWTICYVDCTCSSTCADVH